VNPLQYLLVCALRLYRWVLSPLKLFLFGPLCRCRFAPSCSDYAGQAIQRHGALPGAWLAFKRIARCHPWGGSGFDPVPDAYPCHCCSTAHPDPSLPAPAVSGSSR
jgi:uncharacterized protein